jgi:microcystin-dependent protein
MEPYLGEVMIAGFGFPPRGWALCNGELLNIAQNQALFALLGTTYGGDGITTFALPNFEGRVPLDTDQRFSAGNKGGETSHILNTNEIPAHSHTVYARNDDPNAPSPAGNFWAKGDGAYQTGAGNTNMNPATVDNAGGGQAHTNLQPGLVVNFIIATVGNWPSRD